MSAETRSCDLLVIGGGPAGLAAALAAQPARQALVVERARQLGGLARTIDFEGNLLDVGGHRFLTQDPEVLALWRELLGDRLREVARSSRILYRGRTFAYPLQAMEALTRLGPVESLRVVASYARALVWPRRGGDDLESWMIQRFGRRLYEIFFKTYSEKLWGRPCAELHASWAGQRIRGLSLARAAVAALTQRSDERTLTDRFLYPARGPGEMWAAAAERVVAGGGEIWLDADLQTLHHDGTRVLAADIVRGGARMRIEPRVVVATAPLPFLIHALQPAASAEVLDAASGLTHRAFVAVHLVVGARELFPEQWLYVNDAELRLGRVQNLGNWSADTVRDPATSVLGLEYFCDVDDDLWRRRDADLVQLATAEATQLGLLHGAPVRAAHVVREPHAYPVYPLDLEQRLQVARGPLLALRNLRLAGRGGQHRYGNMDDAMLAGQHAARSLDDPRLSAWPEPGASLVEVLPRPTRAALVRSFARLDPLAFAVACGAVLGLSLLAATLAVVAQGAEQVGLALALLAHYLPGYTVTARGSALALGMGAVWGFLLGWVFATVRNLLIAMHVFRALRRARGWTLRHFLEQL